ncbi:hypothetical protein OAB31_00090 [Polaribacter sp.]|jgi:hypothetical protein|nr:hypothetical protein [Polaribacter sp.]MDA9235400.1 hypothetical protein [Polaribacter sp.]MDA9336997.1 hypothetical protein [Polaribacter sp.]MDA9362811.1 hypothetical protein [Polaribacter sp.]MDB4010055.1 hypothetical protein [Polaribacter sp.]MDB4182666.1 hypothetical protein [Polaribacter sp.]
MFNKKIALTFLFVFTSIVSNAQCAMCKAVVENGDISMAEGVNNGITYLMVFPYLLIGGLFVALYRYKKNAKD